MLFVSHRIFVPVSESKISVPVSHVPETDVFNAADESFKAEDYFLRLLQIT